MAERASRRSVVTRVGSRLTRAKRHCARTRVTLDEVETRLLDFQQYYEQIATPFEWKFTKDDLNALLERIAAHEDAALTPAA